jgi:hypothetical protein
MATYGVMSPFVNWLICCLFQLSQEIKACKFGILNVRSKQIKILQNLEKKILQKDRHLSPFYVFRNREHSNKARKSIKCAGPCLESGQSLLRGWDTCLTLQYHQTQEDQCKETVKL